MTISKISLSLKIAAVLWLAIGVWLASSYVQSAMERAQPWYLVVAGGYTLFALGMAVQAVMLSPENDKALTPRQRVIVRLVPFLPLSFVVIALALK